MCLICLDSTSVKQEEEEEEGEEMGMFHNLSKIKKLNAIPLINWWGF